MPQITQKREALIAAGGRICLTCQRFFPWDKSAEWTLCQARGEAQS